MTAMKPNNRPLDVKFWLFVAFITIAFATVFWHP
jgi:hypothetical protein